MSDTPTPETDALAKSCLPHSWQTGYTWMKDKARDLERRLGEANQLLEIRYKTMSTTESRFATIRRERDEAVAEWQAQAALVKASVDREAETHAAHLALVAKQDGLNLKFAQDLIAVGVERDGLAAEIAMLREALQYYAEEAHWSDETIATEGGDEDVKIITANACIFFDNGDCWRKAQDALAATPATASAELAELREDKARLDWLEGRSDSLIWDDNGFWYISGARSHPNGNTPRQALDAARQTPIAPQEQPHA